MNPEGTTRTIEGAASLFDIAPYEFSAFIIGALVVGFAFAGLLFRSQLSSKDASIQKLGFDITSLERRLKNTEGDRDRLMDRATGSGTKIVVELTHDWSGPLKGALDTLLEQRELKVPAHPSTEAEVEASANASYLVSVGAAERLYETPEGKIVYRPSEVFGTIDATLPTVSSSASAGFKGRNED